MKFLLGLITLVIICGCGRFSAPDSGGDVITPATVNQPNGDGKTLLQLAIASGDVEKAKALLAAGANMHVACPEGKLIHLAAARGNPDMLQLLISAGCDPQSRTSSSNTPLHVASTRATAELLVKQGLVVNAPNIFRETPLHLACIRGNTEVVAFLLQNGADPLARSRDGNTISLNDAANREIAELLVSSGAPVNGDPSYKGRNLPPIWSAASQGRTAVVAFLLEQGVNPDTRSSTGPLDPTALWTAVDRGHNETAALLLTRGAKLDLPGNEKLLASAIGRCRTNLVQTLIAHGANPNEKSSMPLSVAAGNGDFGMVSLLLDAGALPNGPDPTRGTPLVTAAYGKPPITKYSFQVPATALLPNNFLLCMRALIEKGADVKTANYAGLTPLHAAASGNFKAGAELLLSLGASVDAKDQYDATPLHWAVINDAVEVAKLLLQAGAKPNTPLSARAAVVTTRQGDLPSPFGGVAAAAQVPLTLARSAPMKELLISHGAVTGQATPLPKPPLSEVEEAEAAVRAARQSPRQLRPEPVRPSPLSQPQSVPAVAVAVKTDPVNTAIQAGASEADVISILGQPKARISTGKRTILTFANREIVLENGKVTGQ